MTKKQREKRINKICELGETMHVFDVAKIVGVSSKTVRKWLKRRRIPYVKYVRPAVQKGVPYRGFMINKNKTSGFNIDNGGGTYNSVDVAKKCIDVYLERTKELPIKLKS